MIRVRISDCIMALFLVAPPVAVKCEIECLSSTLWSGANDVEVENQLAYIAAPAGLVILDISNPAAPDTVSRLRCPGTVEPSYCDFGWVPPRGSIEPRHFRGGDLYKQDNYLYYARGSAGLLIIDVSNPLTPRIVSNLVAPGQSIGVMVEGDLALLLGTESHVTTVDVSEQAVPSILYTSTFSHDVSAIFLTGSLAYLACNSDSGRIEILDVSDGAEPRLVGWYEGLPADDLFVLDTLAYVVGRDLERPNTWGRLTILDVSDPGAPRLVVDTNAFGDHIVVVTNTAYMLRHWTDIDGSFGTVLYSIDVTDPAHLVDLRRLYGVWEGSASSVVIQDEVAFIGDAWHGLLTVDVSQPDTVVDLFSTSLKPVRNILAKDDLMVAWGGGWVHLLDIEDPSSPGYLGQIDLSYTSSYRGDCGLWIDGGLLYVADPGEDYGLRIYDLSVPDNPCLLSFTPDYWGNKVCVSNDLAYVGRTDGLMVVDVSSPESPQLVGQFQLEQHYGCGNLVKQDSLVYFSCSMCLYIFNVKTPSAPDLLATCDLGPVWDYRGGLDVVGDIALVADTWSGVTIIDVSDASSPSVLTSIPNDSVSVRASIVARDTLVFFGAEGAGVEVWSFADPTAPRLLERYDTPGAAKGLCVFDSLMCVADFTSIQILDLNMNVPTAVDDFTTYDWLPSTPSLSQNYPNPFNPATTIEYYVPTRSAVKIEVFDVLGRKVRALVNRVESTGPHAVIWDGKNESGGLVATGVYFYRLSVDEKVLTKKMVVLK